MKRLISLITLILPPVVAFFVAGLSADAFVSNMASLAGVVTLVPLLAEVIKTGWNLGGVTWFWNIKAMKVISWALSVVLVFISHYANWGFESFEVLKLIGYGIGAGLVANEFFTLHTVKLLLAAIFE